MTDKQLKEAVANAVFAQLSEFDMRRTMRVESAINNESIVSVEIHEISSLQRQVRVKTQSNGTHYYSIKIAEVM